MKVHKQRSETLCSAASRSQRSRRCQRRVNGPVRRNDTGQDSGRQRANAPSPASRGEIGQQKRHALAPLISRNSCAVAKCVRLFMRNPTQTLNFEAELRREGVAVLSRGIKEVARVEEISSTRRNPPRKWVMRGVGGTQIETCRQDMARGRLEEILASIARCQLTRVASTSGEIHFEVGIGYDVGLWWFRFEGLVGIPPVESDVQKKKLK